MLVPSSPLMLATHRVGVNAARSDATQAEPHLMEGENSEGLPKHPLQQKGRNLDLLSAGTPRRHCIHTQVTGGETEAQESLP